jgi:hypothetical protein
MDGLQDWLQDWMSRPAFYAVLVLVLLCLPALFRHMRGGSRHTQTHAHPPPRKRRNFWHRR